MPIQIVILSRKSSLYSTRRLREAAEERGHDVRIIDYLRCVIDIASHRPAIVYAGRRLTGGRPGDGPDGAVEVDEQRIDAIIPRIGASRTFYGTAVVRQFEMMGVYAANESQAISRSRDKLRSLQLLAAEGVGLPVTSFAHSTKDVAGVIKLVGGPPLVIKLLEGTQGMGVVLAETRKAAESVIGAFRQLDANILVQEFIREADGSDIRAFVVGNRVVAAMERRAAAGEFRSNVHRGGTTRRIRLTPEERATAKRAARILGLNVAGVDLMRSDHGPVVLEVNSSPGLEGIEGATGVDVASTVIEFLEKHARPGRQRTRGARG